MRKLRTLSFSFHFYLGVIFRTPTSTSSIIPPYIYMGNVTTQIQNTLLHTLEITAKEIGNSYIYIREGQAQLPFPKDKGMNLFEGLLWSMTAGLLELYFQTLSFIFDIWYLRSCIFMNRVVLSLWLSGRSLLSNIFWLLERDDSLSDERHASFRKTVLKTPKATLVSSK